MPKLTMPQCDVCGSSAPITRASREWGTQHLCYHHEYTCLPHLKDPCEECDAA